jgi:hypothetical protein
VPSPERQRDKDIRAGGTSGELGRGGGGGGSRVHHFEDERRCVEVINLSDPHGAEFATQQKKQIMQEKYVSHIWKKHKLRIGSHILFRNLFLHLKFTQMIARKYKRYIRQFWRKKKKKKFVRCNADPCSLPKLFFLFF